MDSSLWPSAFSFHRQGAKDAKNGYSWAREQPSFTAKGEKTEYREPRMDTETHGVRMQELTESFCFATDFTDEHGLPACIPHSLA
jgi:hypothetical protein